jgi:uncharacterized protein (TIGR01244 family)
MTSDVYVGPAPSEKDLRRFASEGVRTVVDCRDSSERKGPSDTPALAAPAGVCTVSYVNIPVRASQLSEGELEELGQALAKEPGRYLLHCANGLRAEVMSIAKTAIDHRWGPCKRPKRRFVWVSASAVSRS